MKSKYTALTITFMLAFSLINTGPALALPLEEDFTIIVNGKTITPTDATRGIIVQGRVYVPLRMVGDALGVKVSWNKPGLQAVVYKDFNYPLPTRTTAGEDVEIIVEGVKVATDASTGKPYIGKDGRTYVPMRVLANALAITASWDNSKRHAVFTDSTQSVNPAPITPEPVTPEPAAPVVPTITNLADKQMLQSLSTYGTNIRLLDSKIINLRTLASADPANYSQAQLDRFRVQLAELKKFQPVITLPSGEKLTLATFSIFGESRLNATQLSNWLAAEVKRLTPTLQSRYGRGAYPIPANIAQLYLEIGKAYGIRGDVALAQAAKETGYFQYTGDVEPWTNNYCGLGAVGTPCTGREPLNGADPKQVRFEAGKHGAIFSSPRAGVEAHIQHLWAYATNKPLPAGKTLLSPRFVYVNRSNQPYWLELNARWAVPGTTYGQSIITDYWLRALKY